MSAELSLTVSLAAVPEPGTGSLLAAGLPPLLGSAAVLRRRRAPAHV